MQCDDVNIELPGGPLNDLERSLHELGMLATYTNPRQEYLQELRNERLLNTLTINTRYVSNVSIGFRVRPMTPHVRYKPYRLPKREERHRTRSENNDSENTGIVRAIVEEHVDKSVEDLVQLKKAKSLESIVTENNQSNVTVGNFSELEVVSNSIQKLKVVE